MDTVSGGTRYLHLGDVSWSWDTVEYGEGVSRASESVGDDPESMMSAGERLEFRDSLRSLREPEV